MEQMGLQACFQICSLCRCFQNIKSTEAALTLLHRFQAILQRESLRADLEAKCAPVFLSTLLAGESVLLLVGIRIACNVIDTCMSAIYAVHKLSLLSQALS